jgi:CxxC motif-containing protein (DUF1111 family)
MHLTLNRLAGLFSFSFLFVYVVFPSASSDRCGAAIADDAPAAEMVALGKQLFEHEWQPQDTRSQAGDGLGPLFNGQSCAGCHMLGGLGGGGPNEKNVDTLLSIRRRIGGETAVFSTSERELLARIHPGLGTASSVVLHLSGTDPGYSSWRARIKLLAQPGGRLRSSSRATGDRTREVQADLHALESKLFVAGISLGITQRNTTALFGSGLIDSIPDESIEAAAAKDGNPEFQKIRGRVARLPDGRIGRFGWKAQMASLDDFTRAACAIEIGLEVPGHHQPQPIGVPDYAAIGLDLSEHEVQSLIQFVGSLPAPRHKVFAAAKPDPIIDRTVSIASLVEFLRDANPSYRRAAAQALEKRGEEAGDAIQALLEMANDRNPGVADAVGRALLAIDPMSGKQLFTQIGCAACHMPNLGNVKGIYSDLLLHDLGDRLADATLYYGGPLRPSPSDGLNDADPSAPGGKHESIGESRPPSAREWRTPPLWGCSESAPYLHDGRAATLGAAIMEHAGEAADSRSRFAKLTAGEQLLLETYLKSLGMANHTDSK